MRQPKAALFLGALLIVFVIALLSMEAWAWQASVLHVGDGDSFRAERNGKELRIRLYGIDSPEHGQPYWQQSRDLLAKLMAGKAIEVTPIEQDRYGRSVALVEADGLLVNKELVRQGLSWVYPRYCKTQSLCLEMENAQQTAQQMHLGLWQDPHAQPPWKWKRNHPRPQQQRQWRFWQSW